MRELKRFIDGLKEMSYTMVSIGECFDDKVELLAVDELVSRLKDIGIKEIVSEYDESFEFVGKSGKYIEICGVC